MKIIHYCQHVLGIGHLIRTLEILRQFTGHEVILVNGGRPVEFSLPDHVSEFRLPGLMMDTEFKHLVAVDQEKELEDIKVKRRDILFDLFTKEAPELFIVELYPFGRRAFSFEIKPLIKAIRDRKLPCNLVTCSLRDILVESKKHWDQYEMEVIENLNRYFDALLLHSDPRLLKLDDTFSRTAYIEIPVVYTGFVAQKPALDARKRIRKLHRIKNEEILIIASAGGGSVGAPLLKAVLEAFKLMSCDHGMYLKVFTGPFMPKKEFNRLRKMARDNIQVLRFELDFLSHLAAADLSVSMAGYNTCMNILAARVPALVQPFAQNREQRLRAERLAQIGALNMLEDTDLRPAQLAVKMETVMARKFRLDEDIDLEGAARSADWLMKQLKG
jgi:predicted glycosyltransferase